MTDIRLEALSSAHHLDQIREAMNRMQVSGATQGGSFVYNAYYSCNKAVDY